MRTYLCRVTSGELRGITRNDRAWPPGFDLDSDNPQEPLAQRLRALQVQHEPDFAGFVAFDCAHPDDACCNCGAYATKTKYWDGAALASKPALVVKVNGEVVSQPASETLPVPITPGEDFTLRVEAAVPDGTQLTLGSRMARMSLGEVVLTFAGGAAEATLKGPAQGALAQVYGTDKLIRPFGVFIMGWDA
jgi:hypothetical protein